MFYFRYFCDHFDLERNSRVLIASNSMSVKFPWSFSLIAFSCRVTGWIDTPLNSPPLFFFFDQVLFLKTFVFQVSHFPFFVWSCDLDFFVCPSQSILSWNSHWSIAAFHNYHMTFRPYMLYLVWYSLRVTSMIKRYPNLCKIYNDIF